MPMTQEQYKQIITAEDFMLLHLRIAPGHEDQYYEGSGRRNQTIL
jgi:hypothetical protein